MGPKETHPEALLDRRKSPVEGNWSRPSNSRTDSHCGTFAGIGVGEWDMHAYIYTSVPLNSISSRPSLSLLMSIVISVCDLTPNSKFQSDHPQVRSQGPVARSVARSSVGCPAALPPGRRPKGCPVAGRPAATPLRARCSSEIPGGSSVQGHQTGPQQYNQRINQDDNSMPTCTER